MTFSMQILCLFCCIYIWAFNFLWCNCKYTRNCVFNIYHMFIFDVKLWFILRVGSFCFLIPCWPHLLVVEVFFFLLVDASRFLCRQLQHLQIGTLLFLFTINMSFISFSCFIVVARNFSTVVKELWQRTSYFVCSIWGMQSPFHHEVWN